ncbi:MAG TPA: VIT1/CCC1 transporter family protein [Planctomycetota bacterium]|nr:VIT1/CCC1 transporter family protein [Planctomycetota bacterium]
MIGFPDFIHWHLDPAGRLGEILFGLIMALGIIGAVRLGVEDLSNRSMFIAILGCNLAWAVVDGVMFVLVEVFERGRRFRVAHRIQTISADEKALELIRRELGDQLEPLASPEALRVFYGDVLKTVRAAGPLEATVRRGDIFGGVASALVILLATAPILIPYLVIPKPGVAVRVSELIAVVLLFLLGTWWGRVVGANSLKVGFLLTLVGGLLVGVTILLGG